MSGALHVSVRRLHPAASLPHYAHDGDAGADLCSTVEVELSPGQRSLVPTGLSLALPSGYVGLVHPRSGLAARHGLTVLNSPGTVDAGYRGEVMVNLVNLDPARTVRLVPGDRIAQLVIQRVERALFVEVDALPESSRGTGGHGSTGISTRRPCGDPIGDSSPAGSNGASTARASATSTDKDSR